MGTGQLAIPDAPELISQVAAPTYKYTSNGRLWVESREELKRRDARSSYLAASLTQALYPAELPTRVGIYFV